MSVVWMKVWRDLSRNKTRTILAVLSTAVGVFALGFVFGSSSLMRARMTEESQLAHPAHIQLYAYPADDALVSSVRRQDGIADVEAVVSSSLRWKKEGEQDWRDAQLTARQDYQDQTNSFIFLTAGDWPKRDTLAVEQQTMNYFGLQPGTKILIQRGNLSRSVEIVGVARSIEIFPPSFGGSAAFFATPETVEWLTGDPTPNLLNIRLKTWDKAQAEKIAKELQQRLKNTGVSSGGFYINDPTMHPVQQEIDGVFIILGVMGVVSLGLSAFLIINTMNALIAQQVWQIGILKVVGATFGQVVRIYLCVAVIYSVLSLIIAIPLSALGSQMVASGILEMLNIPTGPIRFIPEAVLIQIVVGVLVPILAALFPVIGGARISAHQAISNYGLGGGFGKSRLDRLIVGAQQALPALQIIPRPIVLGVRNTFRRKARVALTLITLTLSGVMFITVMSVGASLNKTLESVLGDFGFDIMLSFSKLERTEKLENLAKSVPGVKEAEAWDIRGAKIKLPGGSELDTQLWAIPPGSNMFRFNIATGREFLPGDDRAILVNQKIADDQGLTVGQVVTLDIGGKETDWTIVGFIINLNNGQRDCFVPFESLARASGTVNRAAVVIVQLEKDASEAMMIDALRATFAAQGLETTEVMGLAQVRERNKVQFDIIVNLLLTMAVLAAVVGSLGLMGTMSINVVERGREIGLMRATGAASPIVAGIFVGEGLLLGILSWLLAIPLSIPGAYFFCEILSQVLLKVEFAYSPQALITWFAIVGILSTVASLWPALRATRISVRESLAYE